MENSYAIHREVGSILTLVICTRYYINVTKCDYLPPRALPCIEMRVFFFVRSARNDGSPQELSVAESSLLYGAPNFLRYDVVIPYLHLAKISMGVAAREMERHI